VRRDSITKKRVPQRAAAGDRNASIKSITRTHARENPNKAAQVVADPPCGLKV